VVVIVIAVGIIAYRCWFSQQVFNIWRNALENDAGSGPDVVIVQQVSVAGPGGAFGFCARCGRARANRAEAFCPGCGNAFDPPVSVAMVVDARKDNL